MLVNPPSSAALWTRLLEIYHRERGEFVEVEVQEVDEIRVAAGTVAQAAS